jgi:urease accessory protein
MATAGRMATATDTGDLLRLTQWLSPAFPVSSYAYSHGLEAEIAAGRVRDAAALRSWVEVVLTRGSGLGDAVFLVAARKTGADIPALTDLARAMVAGRERLEETQAQGRALSDTLSALGLTVPDAPYPVALGVACRDLSLGDGDVAALYLQAFAAMLISAAVRFMPLGQVEGQGVLAALQPVCTAAALRATEMTPEDITQSAFGADMASLEHERLEVRIFRT